MSKYQCNASLQCKSKSCIHAVPHEEHNNCQRSAPCGQWPGDPNFQPFVKCIPVDQVKPRDDCPDCGEKEAKGHNPGNCISNLKRQLQAKQGQCKDCKHWNRDKHIGFDGHYNMGLGKCDAVLEFWDSTQWADDGESRVFTENAKGKLAFSQDGSDYQSWVYTMPAFGCVQFEPKD